MSMEALCALSVSWMRIGSARALISWSLPLLVGYWTTETSVIDPSATVIWTCTGPHRVSAAAPVTVPDAAELEELDEPLAAALVEPAAPGGGGGAGPPAAALGDPAAPVEVVLPLNGVATEESPPATAAVEEVEVW